MRKALSSPDPQAAECQQEVGVLMGRIQAQAFPEAFDGDTQAAIVRTLGHVWFSSLIGWVNGWVGIREAGAELDAAAHLLLDQYE